jgi:hypothetical protein
LWGFRDISSSMGRHDGGSLSAMGWKDCGVARGSEPGLARAGRLSERDLG